MALVTIYLLQSLKNSKNCWKSQTIFNIPWEIQLEITAVGCRGETEPKFSVSSRAEPSHEPEIFNFFRAEPSPSQHLVEPSRAFIFSSRARAEPRAILLTKFSEIFQHSSEARLHSSHMVIQC